MYTKILVPFDFSDASDKSLSKAGEFKEIFQSEIIMVHAIDYLPPTYVQVEMPEVYASGAMMTERAKKQLNERLRKHKLADSTVIVQVGHPKEVLLSMSEEHKPNLIIMAKHAQTGFERLLGSTTNGVLHQAKCEVLVIPVD